MRGLANASQAAAQVVTLSLDTAVDRTDVGYRWRAGRSPIIAALIVRGAGLTAEELIWVRAGPKLISRPSATPGIDKHLADRARVCGDTGSGQVGAQMLTQCLPEHSGVSDYQSYPCNH